MLNNKLYVFEGVDGSGKSTHIQKTKEYLESLGHKVYVTKEPGGTEIGEKIREILLNKDYEIDTITESYLYAASRSLLNDLINKKIEEGYIVLCDRHVLSSYVFQDFNISTYLNAICMKKLKYPIQYLYFQISPEEYKKRSNYRKNTIGLDRIESKFTNEENIKNLIDNYEQIASIYNAIFFNANNSIEETFNQIKDFFNKEGAR